MSILAWLGLGWLCGALLLVDTHKLSKAQGLTLPG